MVSWAIQERLISLKFSEVYTADSTHCTEILGFKHHHCSPGLCVKIVPQCVLNLNSFIRKYLFHEVTREGPARNTSFYLPFFKWSFCLYIFPMLHPVFVCRSGILSGFFLLLSANLICLNNFKDGISKRSVVCQTICHYFCRKVGRSYML